MPTLLLTLHLLSAPAMAPQAALHLVPQLTLGALDPAGTGTATTTADAPPPEHSYLTLHLAETGFGALGVLAADVAAGGLFAGALVLAVVGVGGNSVGFFLIGLSGVVILPIVVIVGLPLLAAELANITSKMLDDPDGSLGGAILGAYVGEGVAIVPFALAFMVVGAGSSSSSSTASSLSSVALLASLLIQPVAIALGASIGLHFSESPSARPSPANPPQPASPEPAAPPPPLQPPPPTPGEVPVYPQATVVPLLSLPFG